MHDLRANQNPPLSHAIVLANYGQAKYGFTTLDKTITHAIIITPLSLISIPHIPSIPHVLCPYPYIRPSKERRGPTRRCEDSSSTLVYRTLLVSRCLVTRVDLGRIVVRWWFLPSWVVAGLLLGSDHLCTPFEHQPSDSPSTDRFSFPTWSSFSARCVPKDGLPEPMSARNK